MKQVHRQKEIENLSSSFVLMIGAEWCGNCGPAKMYLKGIEKKHPNTQFYYIDFEDFTLENNEISKKVKSVSSFPTIYYFNKGKRLYKTEGLNSEGKSKLNAFLK